MREALVICSSSLQSLAVLGGLQAENGLATLLASFSTNVLYNRQGKIGTNRGCLIVHLDCDLVGPSAQIHYLSFSPIDNHDSPSTMLGYRNWCELEVASSDQRLTLI
jgi:hypothetical protein